MKKVFYIYKNNENIGMAENGIRALLFIEKIIGKEFHGIYEKNYLRFADYNGDIYEAKREELK